MRPVLFDPVEIKEEQASYKPPMLASPFSVLFCRIVCDFEAIAATALNDIRMNVEFGFLAKKPEPSGERLFAFSLGTDEEAFSPRDRGARRHSSTENRQPAKRATSILFVKISPTP